MRATQDLVGLTVLMGAVPAVVGQVITVSPSLQSNFSLTSARPTVPEFTPMPTGENHCCYMVAEAVGLNYWWTSTRGPYTATVVTSYIEYDNTVMTELATYTKAANWSGGWLGGTVPSDIIPTSNEYRATVLANYSTVATYPTTTIASPTPHLFINAFDLFTGTRTQDSQGSSSCYISRQDNSTQLRTADRFTLPTGYVYVEDPPVIRTDRAFLPPPPADITASLYSQRLYVTDKWPFISDCPIISGTGQPTVHIAVTGLTSQSSTTVRRAGNAPGATPSSGGQTTQAPEPPAPTSEPAPLPPPSTPNQPETPPTTTQAPPIPEPTGPANPPASSEPPSPPADTQAPPPANTQAPPPADTQAPPPANTQAPPPANTQAPPPANTQAPPPANTQAPPPANTQTPPANTQAPPANTQAPPNPVPGSLSPSDIVNPPAPGNTQLPAGSGGSSPQPSADAVSPPAGPVAPISTPSLPFPIVPVPIPTVDPTNDESPSDETAPTGGNPTNTPQPGGVVLPGDQTLNPGQQTTISGVVISVPSPAVPDTDATPPVVIVDGSTSTVAAAPTSPPLVVVDGTTVTLPAATPTEVDQPVIPVTIGTQVLTLEAPSASGEGIVLPNSETLELGATTVVASQTLVATVVTSGTSVATVVEVADESTTQTVTLPTATPTESGDKIQETGATSTGPEAPEFLGAAVSRAGASWAWGVVNAIGLAFLGFA